MALGGTEAHLARREIRHHDHQLILQLLWRVGTLYSGKNRSLRTAQIERQLQEFIRTFNGARCNHPGNAQIDFGKNPRY